MSASIHCRVLHRNILGEVRTASFLYSSCAIARGRGKFIVCGGFFCFTDMNPKSLTKYRPFRPLPCPTAPGHPRADLVIGGSSRRQRALGGRNICRVKGSARQNSQDFIRRAGAAARRVRL